jgi:hypothetical protein
VRTHLTQRPSALTAAYALVPRVVEEAHSQAVGIPAVLGPPISFINNDSIPNYEHLQVQRTQAQPSLDLADRRRNGFAAKANGMGLASVTTGVEVSGAPPRGRPV